MPLAIKRLKDVRITYAIPGTDVFIVASKAVPVIPPGMAVVKSSIPLGIKLKWDKLTTRKGQPLRCPVRVLALFNELQEWGWKLDKAAFVAHHWKPQ